MPGSTPSSSFLTHTCTVRRYLSVINGDPFPVDSAAGRDDTRGDVPGLAGLACSIQPETGLALSLYDTRTLEVDTVVYFGQAVDVRGDDLLLSGQGNKYLVLAVGDEAEQGRVSWVLCKRLR